MNSSHLVTSANTHQHHHHNQPHVHHYNNMTSNSGDQLAGLTSNMNNNNSSKNSNNANSDNLTATAANKFAPARRLAARQTLRLQIPKQQGDTYATQNAGTTNSLLFKHSPSQLPPAPILKRSTQHTPATAGATTSSLLGATTTTGHHSSLLPKTASPLESHKLPNAYQHTASSLPSALSSAASTLSSASTLSPLSHHHHHRNDGGGVTSLSSATPSTAGKFLNIRKPNITLNSSDIRNNNDLFHFANDLSPAVDINISEHHSPIFADIASSISPSTTSSGCSPTHHLNRLFNLSPSTMRSYGNMSDFSDSSHSGVVSPATSLIENFHKKNGVNSNTSNSNTPTNSNSMSTIVSTSPSINGIVTGVGACNKINTSSSSSSSVKETSSTSQQVVNSSSTTTRVEKKSQRLHHITSSSSSSSSSSSTSEMKTAALKRDLSEIKNSMSEINDLALGRSTNTHTNNSNNTLTGGVGTTQSTHHPSINDLSKLNALNSSDAINQLKKKIRSSIENLVDDDTEPLVTFPDGDDDHHHNLSDCIDLVNNASKGHQLSVNGMNGSSKTVDTVKFEEKRTKTESKTKVVTDGYSSEQATSNLAEMKRLQAGDIDYKEAKAAAATRNRLEVDGVKSEENTAIIQEALSLRTGDITQQASNNVAAASIKVQSDTFSADKKAISQSQQSQTMTSNGIISQEKHVSSASQSNYTMTTHKGVSSAGSSMISSSSQMSATNGHLFKLGDLKLDDLKSLSSASGQREIEQAISKYSNVLTSFVHTLQDSKAATPEKFMYLDKINEVMQRAWAIPTHGHELGYSLCNSLRNSGGLDMLMKNCMQSDMKIKFSSAKLLEQCLTTENRTHVVDNGLDKVVNVACVCTKNTNTEHSRVGTGILEHLFKHSEGTCSDVIKLGGLDAVLFECRTSDVETLRHCASALANLSLYGGAENQEAMIYRKVPMWLFPLAFHDDDNIKYYACLAIAVLVANKEIEAEVLKSGCLDLVEPFVTTHDPSEFAKSNLAHAHGQSKHWLQRLVPVLSSNREEARNLAAFHFCMEAGIKREQGNTEIFREIGAIEALKTVASCPNAIASKFAAQALRLIGETVPHKLSQQVPLWSVEDVQEWVKQIGFGQFVQQFEESQVDGDLLLKLNEANLRADIGILNGILLKRFERELQNLKRMADYSSKDTAKMHQFLSEIGPEYCTYTYSMLNAGIDKMSLPHVNEDMLIAECGVKNSIHRLRILNAVRSLEKSLPSSSEENMAKTLDVFVSYRRSNGSQLASLLKVHLELRGFSVFIDVERLEAGKFDNGLLNSIRQAKNFVLVLTPNALERCVEDEDGKDWVHREIVAALNANCNIIPIIDQQFMWPETEKLPEDMRSVCHFNGVTWIHDYQDACIDKLERFMRGEKNVDRIIAIPSTPGSASATYQRMHSNDSDYGSGSCAGSSVVGSVGAGGVQNGGGQAANHQANRYRQSSSPARQRLVGGGASGLMGSTGMLGSNGSQLSVFGRGSKRTNMLPPFRTQQTSSHKVLPIGGSMQNVTPLANRPPRRSSAVNISNGSNATTLPSNYRSHSVDGLLDTGSTATSTDERIAEVAALVTAGSIALTNASSTSTLQPNNDYACSSMSSLTELNEPGEAVAKREKSANSLAPNPQHRKSRSLDHFLDEKTLAALVVPPAPTDGTQSMQNLAIPVTPDVQRGVRTQPFPLRVASQRASQQSPQASTPERVVMMRHNAAVTRQSPECISSTEDEREDVQSMCSTVFAASGGNGGSGSVERKSQTRAPAHVHRGSSNRDSNNSNKSVGANSNSSSSNNNANNKTIFNRTMKKVRSLIKKP